MRGTKGTRRNKTWPVGSLKPNDFGLFDVQGNVYTWCQDRYRKYPAGKGDEASADQEDGLVAKDTDSRVVRGGSFDTRASFVRSAYRVDTVPAFRVIYFGFRPARTIMP